MKDSNTLWLSFLTLLVFVHVAILVLHTQQIEKLNYDVGYLQGRCLEKER